MVLALQKYLWVPLIFPSLWEERGVRLGRVDWGKGGEKIESPPKLGLGTIYIAPLHGMIDFTPKVWVQSLGTILEMY